MELPEPAEKGRRRTSSRANDSGDAPGVEGNAGEGHRKDNGDDPEADSESSPSGVLGRGEVPVAGTDQGSIDVTRSTHESSGGMADGVPEALRALFSAGLDGSLGVLSDVQ